MQLKFDNQIKKTMSFKKSLLMKLSCSVIMVIAFAISSCAQNDSKSDSAKQKGETQTVQTQTIKMSIEGMVCSACQSSVKKTIRGLDGIKNVEVSLENRNAIVTYYPNLIKADSIQKAVNKGGFTAGKPQVIKQ